MFDGYTQEISETERLFNEVETCLKMVELAPQNEYWRKRLAYAVVDEINYHQELPVWAYLVPPEPISLNDMTDAQRTEWWNSLPMINPETGEMEQS